MGPIPDINEIPLSLLTAPPGAERPITELLVCVSHGIIYTASRPARLRMDLENQALFLGVYKNVNRI
jgi:hypothetical protein